MTMHLSSLWLSRCFMVLVTLNLVAGAKLRDPTLIPAPLRINRSHSASVVESMVGPPFASDPFSSSPQSSLKDLQLTPSTSQPDLRSTRSMQRLVRQTPIAVRRLPVEDADRGRFPNVASASKPSHTTSELSRWDKVLFEYRAHNYDTAAKYINRLSYASLPVHYNRALIYLQWYLSTGESNLLHCAAMDADRAISATRHFYPAYLIKARISFLMRRYRLAYDLLRNLYDLLALQVADRNCIVYDAREYVGVIYMADIVANMALTAFRFGGTKKSNELFALASDILCRDMQSSNERQQYIYDDKQTQYQFIHDNVLLIPDFTGVWMEPIRLLKPTELIPTQFTLAKEAFSMHFIQKHFQRGMDSKRLKAQQRGRSPLAHVTTANEIIMRRLSNEPIDAVMQPFDGIQNPNDAIEPAITKSTKAWKMFKRAFLCCSSS